LNRPPRQSRRGLLGRHRRRRLGRPLAVAVTGGIGAGKSEALAAFARHGAATISSDEIVHRLLREDDEVKERLRRRFGEEIFDASGAVNRATLSKRVFADRRALDWLEQLLHPLVRREYGQWREQCARQSDPPRLCVVEIPLLYETGGEAQFDAVVVITAPADLRAARSASATPEREQRLLPDDEKVARADFAYVNDGSLEELETFVRGVIETLDRRHK
jgi:dephospho-CoA kinase